MRKHIQLSIDNPCHENWENMSPTEKGRFCGSCQKQVVDFTKLSDSQVAAFFKKPSTGSVCGRFFQDQLDRDMEIPKKRIPWVKYFFQFAMPAFLVSMKATAQGKPMVKYVKVDKSEVQARVANLQLTGPVAKVTKESLASLPKLSLADLINEGRVKGLLNEAPIKGRIIDEAQKPIPYASVMVKGTQIGVAADSNGIFKLDRQKPGIVLEISSVGYETKQTEVADADLKQEMVIQLAPKTSEEVVVVTTYTTGLIRRQTVQGYTTGTVGEALIVKKDSVEMKVSDKKITVPSPMRLYPNPVSRNSNFNIELNSEKDEPIQLSIVAMNGSQVSLRSEKIVKGFNRLSLNADGSWAAGVYIIQLRNEKGMVIKQDKLVIQ